MNEIKMDAKGICRLCFEPVWNDQPSIVSKKKFNYHERCAGSVKDLDEWEQLHSKPRRGKKP